MNLAGPEQELWAAAGEEVPALAPLWEASCAIYMAIDHRRVTLDVSADDPVGDALGGILIFVFRALRATGVLVATGYSAEAQGDLRRIAEFSALARAVTEPNGRDIAERWNRERMSPSKLLNRDVQSTLSVAAHADAAHLGAIITPGPDGPDVNAWPVRSEHDALVALSAATSAHEILLASEAHLGFDDRPIVTLTASLRAAAADLGIELADA